MFNIVQKYNFKDNNIRLGLKMWVKYIQEWILLHFHPSVYRLVTTQKTDKIKLI